MGTGRGVSGSDPGAVVKEFDCSDEGEDERAGPGGKVTSDGDAERSKRGWVAARGGTGNRCMVSGLEGAVSVRLSAVGTAASWAAGVGDSNRATGRGLTIGMACRSRAIR